MTEIDRKPLGIKNYGTIPLLPNSRVTPADHHCHEGQNKIATEKVRDKNDVVIIQEKLDGSNTGVALFNGQILAVTRAGYLADTSPYQQHWMFADWVKSNESRFRYVLNEGERLCGEWLAQAHSTRYNLWHEPWVAFDLMVGHNRLLYHQFSERVAKGDFTIPYIIHIGGALSVSAVLDRLGKFGHHGAIDEVEGAVWRIERRGEVDFLVKYLKPYKEDGIYLPEKSGKEAIWNWQFPYRDYELIMRKRAAERDNVVEESENDPT